MNIDNPDKAHTPALRTMWREAFGDSEDFLDAFEKTAFSADRCRCITVGDKIAAALYWFNCSYIGGRVAYLYAVATAKAYRKRGFCTALMENTHQHLKSLGYACAVLVPGSKDLFDFYKKMGYRVFSYLEEFNCAASENSAEIRKISTAEYGKLRRSFLPKNSVIQENENLEFLKAQADFYTGGDFLLAARKAGDALFGIELLGSTFTAPDILRALGCSRGKFRTPGGNKPFAMYLPLNKKEHTPPSYFGLAFD